MKSSAQNILIKTKNNSKTNRSVSFSKKAVSPTKSSKTNHYAKRTLRYILLSKTFQITVKAMLFVMLLSTGLYGAYAVIENTVAEDIIISKSEIINRVMKLTTLPNENPEAVVRVENPENLQKQNSFYSGVKEGDYIIVYPELAVIYDLRNDAIVGLKVSDR